VDVAGGLLACEGILAALYRRERFRRGGRVMTSLWAGALALEAEALAGRAPAWGALDRPVEMADGHFVVGINDDEDRLKAIALCGLSGGATDRVIADRLGARAAAEWEGLFLTAGVPAAVVRADLAALPHDPLVGPALEHVPEGCWAPAAPWRFHT
jgi:crotonobetainyl-CoA:carnitine CoA-transferase CaiB-like acyl-CoA transferase